MTAFNKNRTYGVEMEVVTNRRAETLARAITRELQAQGIEDTACQVGTDEGRSYGHSVSRNWKIVSDVTISPRGWEVVSPILKGFNGKAQIEAVCKALNDLDCTVNMSVGMHIHHDARGLTAKQFGAIFGTYAAFQTLLNYGVARSRRGTQYGGYNTVADWEYITAQGTETFDNFEYGIDGNTTFQGPRHSEFIYGVASKLQVNRANSISYGTSLDRHGTIEFRQHQGTINATKIWTWLLVTQSIIETHIQNRVRFPKPLRVEMSNGKSHAKGDFVRFKNFIGITAETNNMDAHISEPYMWAFRQLHKNIKKFSREAGIADVKDIAR